MREANMHRTLRLAALVAALHPASPAWAHGDSHKQATGAQTPAAAAASGAAATTAAAPQDARSYFTDLELVTQDGRKVRFYSDMLEGRTVVINVIYTNCQDACPLITQQLNEVRHRMPELFGKQVFFVSLSSDPKRDTPKALKQFAQKQNADVEGWTFLTGRQENIDHILKKLGQYSQDVEDHSTLLIAGNVPAKRWSKILANAPSAAIAARLSVLAGASDAAPARP
jgi:cytochrome oxidase Cu insertion factor (SCO1/SenC/PrrC family)